MDDEKQRARTSRLPRAANTLTIHLNGPIPEKDNTCMRKRPSKTLRRVTLRRSDAKTENDFRLSDPQVKGAAPSGGVALVFQPRRVPGLKALFSCFTDSLVRFIIVFYWSVATFRLVNSGNVPRKRVAGQRHLEGRAGSSKTSFLVKRFLDKTGECRNESKPEFLGR